ncbi:unnamed protein product [Ixodes persulcatus]
MILIGLECTSRCMGGACIFALVDNRTFKRALSKEEGPFHNPYAYLKFAAVISVQKYQTDNAIGCETKKLLSSLRCWLYVTILHKTLMKKETFLYSYTTHTYFRH